MKPHRVLTALAVLALAVLLAGGAQAQLDPDLAITDVGTEDDSKIKPGATLTLEAEIDNEGDGDSNNFWYGFHVDGEQLGEIQEDEDGLGLDEGPITVTSTADWQVEAGQHTIEANLSHNDTDLQTEQDPDNNHSAVTYTIGADLSVTDLEVSPTDPTDGEQVELTATVENTADPGDIASDTNETFDVKFYVDGQDFTSTAKIDGLAAGGVKKTEVRTWTASEGQHDINATVDPLGAVPDQDPDNDDADPVTVDVEASLADLVVGDLSHSPDPARPDEQVTFTATVRNNGQSDAGEHDLVLEVDDEQVDSATISSVPAGGEENTTLTWQATAGDHNVEVTADVTDNITEGNEDNNAWTLDLPVGSDLVIRDFRIQPSEPRASDRVRFTAEIGNEGLAVDDTFAIAFDVGDERIDTIDVDGLANGEVRNLTSTAWNATEGDHDVSVTVDPSDQIAEVDQTNNKQERSFTVGEPKPDLTVLSAVLDPATPAEGETATVRAQVENGGARDAEAFSVKARLDGEETGSARVDGLEAGQQTTVDLGEWTAEAGGHELAVQVDSDHEIDEASENNTLVRAFGIGNDLGVVELSLSPTEPGAGEETTALVLVQNNGTTGTPATNVTFRLDGDEIGTVVLDPLDPNEQGRAELTFTATQSGSLEAHVDADEELDEFDEENNQASTALELTQEGDPPDLTIRSVSVEGSLDGEEPVQFTAEVENAGAGPSPRALVDFRVDGSSIDGPVRIDGLQAGGTVEATSGEWTPSSDAEELEVRVDPDDRVDESDETNNAHTQSLDAGAVDLPTSPLSALLAGLAAAIAYGWRDGSKQEPPRSG